MLKIVAPHIGGVKASDGSMVAADEKVDGGPSVVFDAVALLVSEEGAKALSKMPPARDFVADAFAHLKFVAYSEAAEALLDKAGVAPDDGFVLLSKAGDASGFVETCRKVRHWDREAMLKQA